MRLTAFTDYSLRVLIYLAARPGQRATIAEIADAFGIKQNHLTKVVHFLGREGLLANARGKGGGLDLARDPERIVIGDVVRRTEGAARPAECFAGEASDCRIYAACRLRGALDAAVQAFYGALDGVTLADLVADRSTLAPLLFVPRGDAAAAAAAAAAAQ